MQLAQKMAAMIQKGVYRSGDRLPSLRQIHLENGLSIGTVLQAFNHLQDTGMVTAREKSGYFVTYQPGQLLPQPRTIPLSLSERSVHIDSLLLKLRKGRSGKNFVPFANALPDHRLLPFNAIRRAIQQTSRDSSGAYLEMEDPRGNLQLREAIARRSFTWGGSLHADDLVITNGATEALNLCLKAVTQPGDTVLIQEPCYYGILQSLEFLNLKALAIPCHSETGIELDDLENACARRGIKTCILVSNFNNPTGACLSTAKKKKLAAFAGRNKIVIIEDDLYGDIFFGQVRPDTIKTYDRNGWVLLCSSFSKSLIPGFRLGWCAPGMFGYEVARLKSMSDGASGNFSQKVLLQLLHTGAYDRHLVKFRKELHKNLVATSLLIHRHFPEGTKITRPSGGLVIWVQLPEHIDAVQLQDLAFSAGMSIAPGEIFSAGAAYKNYIRLSFCSLWNIKIEKALIRLGALCHSSTA
jgi:DNA-binding transcriptional MocR family regulator